MSVQIISIFLLIIAIGLGLFWWFYRNSNSIHKQAKKYLLNSLKDQSITTEQRQQLENQLSALLQKQATVGGFKIVMLVALCLLPFSLYFYILLGNPEATATDKPIQQMPMQEAISQLEQKLLENPNDVDRQILYARSQVSLKNYDKAVLAYRKANELAANEAVILTELAEAIALANNNSSFLGEPEQLLAQAVALEPDNQKALWLLGMTYYERKDFVKTDELWTKLLGLVTNEEAKKQLNAQLAEVRAKL
ncbi:MAG: hypothetical protein L3J53_01420 [Proteobacteria bacterium]|nr:hypothetical protein [Pseudomonadota bacterium]